ncbi:hypothetical protein Bca52824_027730 [Brassica carinata]|uniref:Uncharacterized protein n=1 Tax=Brassica carinata TaxID=52824 RepID=A0A8X7VB00_BRACI|nr:hypothetical protein Bca52824_027730 [Brassica carinata]
MLFIKKFACGLLMYMYNVFMAFLEIRSFIGTVEFSQSLLSGGDGGFFKDNGGAKDRRYEKFINRLSNEARADRSFTAELLFRSFHAVARGRACLPQPFSRFMKKEVKTHVKAHPSRDAWNS